jgi:hypothetical protein
MELDIHKPVFEDPELLKALTKQIYYKRIDTVSSILNENAGKINFIGQINPEKKNTCTFL